MRVVFHRPGTSDSLVLEDDGAVAYAYVVLDGEIQGDVWLYNRVPAPKAPPWETPGARGRMPFLNPVGFTQAEPFAPVRDADDLGVVWCERQGVPEAALYVRGRLHAIVAAGDRPGRCALALQDGPLARRLVAGDET